MNLVILEPDELRDGSVRLSGARATHLVRVLKVAAGHHVRVGLLDGPFGEGIVQSMADGTVEMRCTFDRQPPPRPQVDLLLALPRPKVMRRLWAQLAALGVGQIVLTNAERVERQYFDTHVLAVDTFRPLLIEGLQQARDTWLPRVTIHRQFKVFVEDVLGDLCPGGRRLLADPAARRSIADCLQPAHEKGERVLLAVGPEGGWNDYERRLLAEHDFDAISIGRRTLRTDTACIALLALINDALMPH